MPVLLPAFQMSAVLRTADIVALLVGIDMVVGGAALIFMMLYARNAAD